MADAVETLGWHAHQKAADELVRGQRHGLEAAWAFDAVILLGEGDAVCTGAHEES
jgi:hypothetical protein